MSIKPKLAISVLFAAAILLGVIVRSRPPRSPLVALGYEHQGVYPAQETAHFVATNITDRPLSVGLFMAEVYEKGIWRDGANPQMVLFRLEPRSKHVFSVPIPDNGESWRVRLLIAEEKHGLQRIIACAQYIWREVIHGRGFKTPPRQIIRGLKTNTCEFPI